MWVLEDSHGCPQCAWEKKEFDSMDDLLCFIDADEELLKRIELAYAVIYEV